MKNYSVRIFRSTCFVMLCRAQQNPIKGSFHPLRSKPTISDTSPMCACVSATMICWARTKLKIQIQTLQLLQPRNVQCLKGFARRKNDAHLSRASFNELRTQLDYLHSEEVLQREFRESSAARCNYFSSTKSGSLDSHEVLPCVL